MRNQDVATVGLFRPGGHPLGCHRVLRPEGVLPQAADCLDVSLPLYQNEILLKVEGLQLDSASFRQLKEKYSADSEAIARSIMDIVAQRGKMQNPVTGSGGMLWGTVQELGPDAPQNFLPGDRVASLISLTLTPLHLEKIHHLSLKSARVAASGHAILFASSSAAKIPDDLPESSALAVFDVCGAPAWVKKLVHPGDKVLILGAGKSGLLSAFAAGDITGKDHVWLSDQREEALAWCRDQGGFAKVVLADASRPWDFLQSLEAAKAPGFDLVVNCSNALETETSCILATKPKGRILFFNMATQFSRAVLSAEGLGREVEMTMGNGYAEGHWAFALDLVRRHHALKDWFNLASESSVSKEVL